MNALKHGGHIVATRVALDQLKGFLNFRERVLLFSREVQKSHSRKVCGMRDQFPTAVAFILKIVVPCLVATGRICQFAFKEMVWRVKRLLANRISFHIRP